MILRAIDRDFSAFERCAEEAPEGTYEHAKAIRAMIGGLADKLIRETVKNGLLANTCDHIREIEWAVYNYLRVSNPDATVFEVSEKFGICLRRARRIRRRTRRIRRRTCGRVNGCLNRSLRPVAEIVGLGDEP